jgi:hypothetical protein
MRALREGPKGGVAARAEPINRQGPDRAALLCSFAGIYTV